MEITIIVIIAFQNRGVVASLMILHFYITINALVSEMIDNLLFGDNNNLSI